MLRAVSALVLAALTFCASPLEPEVPLAKRHHHGAVCAPYTGTVTPDTATIPADSALAVSMSITSPCGGEVPNIGVNWISRAPVVATVSDTGHTAIVTARAAGQAYIVGASTSGGALDSMLVTVTGSAASCTSTATHFCPGDDLDAKVQAAGTNTSFTYGAGTYREQQISPKTGDSFTGVPGAVMDGGHTLTGWTVSGATWFVGGQGQHGAVATAGKCELTPVPYVRCQYPEQLWMDGVLKRPVAALGDVTAGTWFFDYSAKRIYVGDNPTGHVVETSVSDHAFESSAANVTIHGLTVQHYAPSGAGAGAITAKGNNWTITGNTVVDNGGSGIQAQGAFTALNISDNEMSRNGQYGLSISSGSPTARVDKPVVERNHLYDNNTAHWARGFGAGGMKLTRTDSMQFNGNRAEGNNGNGFWWDVNDRWVLADRDTAVANAGSGFMYEISYGLLLDHAVATGNGTNPADAFQNGAGILCSASSDCEIRNSTVSGNVYGIIALQQDRGSGDFGAHLVTNLFVHDNDITMDRGTSGFKGTFEQADYNFNRNNRFATNHYTLTGAANYFSSNGAQVNTATWQAAGQDTGSTFDQVP